MRIIHTADWHLGQTFYEFDRSSEHSAFLEWLLKVLEGNATACATQSDQPKADVLLIAGDVFDTANPSAASQKMYYQFLLKAKQKIEGLQTVIIAGNHDSAARLEAPSDLLVDALDVHAIGKVLNDEGKTDCAKMCLALKGLNVIAVPYIRNIDLPNSKDFSKGVSDIYTECLDYSSTLFDKSLPLIGMGHQFMNGAKIRDVEKAETLGNAEKVDTGYFSGMFQYFALGHLHMEQAVNGCDTMRYSGAPLPMSFSEIGNKQSVTEVIFAYGSKTPDIKTIPFDAPAKLLSIPKSPKEIDVVLAEIRQLDTFKGDECSMPYLRVNVKSDFFTDADRAAVIAALEEKRVRLVKINVEPLTPRQEGTDNLSYEKIADIRKDPMEIIKDVYRRVFGNNDMPKDLAEMMKGIVDNATKNESHEN